jgi:hypothetical protein
MTNKINNNDNKGTFNGIKNQLNQWYNAIILIVLIGSGIGNYMVSNYRHDQHDKEIARLDARVKVTESVNYELLLTQLESIQDANNELTKKINETNGRIDKVLEILIDK